MKELGLLICLSIASIQLAAADLTAEQVEQQIQLSHMLGQITQSEQNVRIQKVRTLGVEGYYAWLKNENQASTQSVKNTSSK